MAPYCVDGRPSGCPHLDGGADFDRPLSLGGAMAGWSAWFVLDCGPTIVGQRRVSPSACFLGRPAGRLDRRRFAVLFWQQGGR
jgi:hypothetical protein